tara:strand:+ start:456 stop:668 length:213 start_codon:yes stop_codon:yes gene_type:complete
MNIESQLGARVFELRDVVKANTVKTLIENLGKRNINIKTADLRSLQFEVESIIDTTFAAGLHNVFSALQE